MTLPSNSINTLSRISVKPKYWIVTQSKKDYKYSLKASYIVNEPRPSEYFSITTARGTTKTYSAIKSVITDIRKIESNPIIQFHFEE